MISYSEDPDLIVVNKLKKPKNKKAEFNQILAKNELMVDESPVEEPDPLTESLETRTSMF